MTRFGSINTATEMYTSTDVDTIALTKVSEADMFINAKKYATGDGVTDDTTALSNALDAANSAGKSLYLPPGQYVSGAISKSYMPKIWAYPGTVTILSTNTASGAVWTFGSSTYGTANLLTSDLSKSTFTVSIASTSGFSANDLIILQTDTADDGVAYAQTVRVLSVDSSTQLTINEPAYQDFLVSANAKIRKLPANQDGGYVKGVKFKNIAASTTQSGFLLINYGQNIDIDVEGEGAGGPGVQIEGCYQFRVRHVANRYYDNAGASQFGYGVNISGASAHGEVNVIADQVRHAVAFNGTNNNVHVTGVAHGTSATAWDAHKGSVNIVFDNCQAFGCKDFAFQLRGKRQHVHGGIADQCYGGVFLFDSPGENEIKGVRFSNILSNGDTNRGNGIVISKAMTGLTIANNDFYNITRSAISSRSGTVTDVKVTGNRFTNVGTAAVANEGSYFKVTASGGLTNVRITGNTFNDNQGSPTVQYGLHLDSATNTDVTLYGNSFQNLSVANIASGTGAASMKIGTNYVGNAPVDKITDVTYSATPTFDMSLSNIQRMTLTGNVTSSTFSNSTDGQTVQIVLVQDATGSRTFVWPATVVWPGGAPTLSTTANAVNRFTFTYMSSTSQWVGASQSSSYDPTAIHQSGDETATGTKTFSTKIISGAVGDPQGTSSFDAADILNILKKTADQNGAVLQGLKRGNATNGTSDAPLSGANLLGVRALGWNTVGYQNSSDIDFVASQDWSSTQRGTRIDFFNTANGTNTRAQVLRLDQDKSLINYGLIKPNVTNSYDIGTSSLRYNTIFVNNISTAWVSKTGAYTITTADSTISADGTSAAFNVTLPTAVGNTGREFVIKKIDSSINVITVNTTSSQTIDGSTTYALNSQWKYVRVQSNGTNWIIIGNN